MTVCSVAGCGKIVEKGRCEEHEKIAKANMPVSRAHYASPAWRAVRELVLARDGYTCVSCGRQANEVNHRTPVQDGGDDDPDNLEAMCRVCHGKRTREEMGVRGQREQNLTPAPPPVDEERLARAVDRYHRGSQMLKAGSTDAEVMEACGVTTATVGRWRRLTGTEEDAPDWRPRER
jgi:5-methylcytosine-specific restriction protein A